MLRTHYGDAQRKDYGRRSGAVRTGSPASTTPTGMGTAGCGQELPVCIAHTESRLTEAMARLTRWHYPFLEDRVQLTLGVRRQQVPSPTASARPLGHRTNPLRWRRRHHPGGGIAGQATDRVSVAANYIEGLSEGRAAAPMTAKTSATCSPLQIKQKEVGIKVDRQRLHHTRSLYEITNPSRRQLPPGTDTNIFPLGGEQRNRGRCVEWGFSGAAYDVRPMGGVAHIDPKITGAQGRHQRGARPPSRPARAAWKANWA